MDDKLKKAYRVIQAARRCGDEWLLWALELYPAREIYGVLLKHGFVWDCRARSWSR